MYQTNSIHNPIIQRSNGKLLFSQPLHEWHKATKVDCIVFILGYIFSSCHLWKLHQQLTQQSVTIDCFLVNHNFLLSTQTCIKVMCLPASESGVVLTLMYICSWVYSMIWCNQIAHSLRSAKTSLHIKHFREKQHYIFLPIEVLKYISWHIWLLESLFWR